MAFRSVGEGSAGMQYSAVVQEHEIIIRHPGMLVAEQFLVVNQLLHQLAGLCNRGSLALPHCPHYSPLLCRLGFWPWLQVTQRWLPYTEVSHINKIIISIQLMI
jgi:hypothetical protein